MVPLFRGMYCTGSGFMAVVIAFTIVNVSDDSVVDLLMKLAQFYYFGHVSNSLVAKSTTAVNPNPDQERARGI